MRKLETYSRPLKSTRPPLTTTLFPDAALPYLYQGFIDEEHVSIEENHLWFNKEIIFT